MIGIDLSGKTILITGALGAIAEHMVKRLSASGAKLVLTDIKTKDDAEQMLHQWQISPSSYLYVPADITDSKQVDSLVNADCIPSQPLPKPNTSASFASTISPKPIWPAPRSRSGPKAKLPAT